ncbi:2516_t:CDS:2 [Diversispora eburnea]|uniref:2516_t:CDS:1 n=1 Tax=Diversispora eburnea TaxID=1213867 RepID=A0A9N8VNX6_9GLOM|nr:2516_t:CDS:2 [Diversispora eburnea]
MTSKSASPDFETRSAIETTPTTPTNSSDSSDSTAEAEKAKTKIFLEVK